MSKCFFLENSLLQESSAHRRGYDQKDQNALGCALEIIINHRHKASAGPLEKRVMQQDIDNWEKAATVRKNSHSGNLQVYTEMKPMLVVK